MMGFTEKVEAGKRFKTLCPYHEEETPSMVVHPSEEYFYCFGCGKEGTIGELERELHRKGEL